MKPIKMNNPPDLSDKPIIPPCGEWKTVEFKKQSDPEKLMGESSFAFPTLKNALADSEAEKSAELCAEVDRGLLADLARIESQILELETKRQDIAKLAEVPLRNKRETHLQIAKDCRTMSEHSLAEVKRITALLGDSFNIND